VMPLLLLGITIAWWVSYELGGWLSYLLSEERVAQAMSVGMRSVTIITIFATIAGLGIGWFLTWVLTRPILEMTHVARHIENGDLSVRAPVWAKDEIGELGGAFNAMLSSLEHSRQQLERSNQQLTHRNQELAILYELADMANQVHTPQEVSAHGLRRAQEITGAQAGMVLVMTDAQTDIAASNAIPERFLRYTLEHLPTHELPATLVLANEQDAARQHYPSPVHELIQESRQLGYQTFFVVPITVKSNLLGMLVLLFKKVVMLSPQEQQLISGICNQLGVSLQTNQLWEELKQKEHLRSQLLKKVVTAQEEERQRISRELHDETGQALTSLLIQLKLLDRCESLSEMKASTDDIRKLVMQTLHEVRRLAAHLRPAALDDLGLISAVEGYIYDYAGKTGIEVDFQAEYVQDIRLPHEVEIVLYRVIQESLTNIARHAEASQAHVLMARSDDRMRVTIDDNGCGFIVSEILSSENRGLGLLGMQERIQLVGGNFNIESQPGAGTRVEIELKLPETVRV
ncbi:MAG: HAMP domain-containing protein, partial [Anaerolineae bacterium]|nr:HAMP domain-containing protein [Anaerolineae bacterium]